MNLESNDDTLKEILLEDEKEIQNGGKKKRSCLARLLILLIVILILFLGFIFVQQYLLDLEAQAIVSAARTATAERIDSDGKTPKLVEETEISQTTFTETPEPASTPTDDPALKRTSTVAVQLTDVAEFQQTITPEP